MKKEIFTASSRGHADHGWLDSWHSFSFANYQDPERMGFGLLRVVNDDTVAAGEGFGRHPHQNMEIISIPLSGRLAHTDSTGRSKEIIPGEVQIMSAGTGIAHSEYNASDTEQAKFLQIWIFPKEKNIAPRYDQKVFDEDQIKDQLLMVVSPEKDGDALWINQDAWLSMGKFESAKELEYKLKKDGDGVFFFIIEGEAEVEGDTLKRRDAAGISEVSEVSVRVQPGTHLLVIEVPMK